MSVVLVLRTASFLLVVFCVCVFFFFNILLVLLEILTSNYAQQ